MSVFPIPKLSPNPHTSSFADYKTLHEKSIQQPDVFWKQTGGLVSFYCRRAKGIGIHPALHQNYTWPSTCGIKRCTPGQGGAITRGKVAKRGVPYLNGNVQGRTQRKETVEQGDLQYLITTSVSPWRDSLSIWNRQYLQTCFPYPIPLFIVKPWSAVQPGEVAG